MRFSAPNPSPVVVKISREQVGVTKKRIAFYKKNLFAIIGKYAKKVSIFNRFAEFFIDKWLSSSSPFMGNAEIAKAYFGATLAFYVPLRLIQKELPDWLAIDNCPCHTLQPFIAHHPLTHLMQPAKYLSLSKQIKTLVNANWQAKNTSVYQTLLAAANTKPHTRHQVRLDNEAKIQAYFDKIKSLYDSIKTQGLQMHSVANQANFRGSPIYVGIDADGQLFKLPSGKHRLAIAKVLELKSVPVVVSMIHADWIKKKMQAHHLSAVQTILYIEQFLLNNHQIE
jgi:hypothetical protein